MVFFGDNLIMNISSIIFLILFIFLLFLFFTYIISILKKKKKYPELKEYPKLSILIPAYNEEKNIINCLNSSGQTGNDTAVFPF